MGEVLSEVPVVGEQQQTFTLCVQATDVEQARQFRGEQIKDGIACVRVGSGRDEAARLVKHDVKMSL
jgi:hypothetical protein